MNKTSIEYLDYTWSPIAMRCTPCSPGCTNCWHIRTADRMSHNHYSFPLKIREAYAGRRGPVLVDERLNDPLKRKKPARIGIQFMGDLFHKDVSDGQRDLVFNAAYFAPQHEYLILTKRVLQMQQYFEACRERGVPVLYWERHGLKLWKGITICNQEEADAKIPILLQIPAATHFVSCEPLLGKIDLSGWL